MPIQKWKLLESHGVQGQHCKTQQVSSGIDTCQPRLSDSVDPHSGPGSWPLCWGHVEAERLPSQPGGRGSPDPGPPAFSPSLSGAVTLQGEGEGQRWEVPLVCLLHPWLPVNCGLQGGSFPPQCKDSGLDGVVVKFPEIPASPLPHHPRTLPSGSSLRVGPAVPPVDMLPDTRDFYMDPDWRSSHRETGRVLRGQRVPRNL